MLALLKEAVGALFAKELPIGTDGVSVGGTYRTLGGKTVKIIEERDSKGLFVANGYVFVGNDGNRYNARGWVMTQGLEFPDILVSEVI